MYKWNLIKNVDYFSSLFPSLDESPSLEELEEEAFPPLVPPLDAAGLPPPPTGPLLLTAGVDLPPPPALGAATDMTGVIEGAADGLLTILIILETFFPFFSNAAILLLTSFLGEKSISNICGVPSRV